VRRRIERLTFATTISWKVAARSKEVNDTCSSDASERASTALAELRLGRTRGKVLLEIAQRRSKISGWFVIRQRRVAAEEECESMTSLLPGEDVGT